MPRANASWTSSGGLKVGDDRRNRSGLGAGRSPGRRTARMSSVVLTQHASASVRAACIGVRWPGTAASNFARVGIACGEAKQFRRSGFSSDDGPPRCITAMRVANFARATRRSWVMNSIDRPRRCFQVFQQLEYLRLPPRPSSAEDRLIRGPGISGSSAQRAGRCRTRWALARH